MNSRDHERIAYYVREALDCGYTDETETQILRRWWADSDEGSLWAIYGDLTDDDEDAIVEMARDFADAYNR